MRQSVRSWTISIVAGVIVGSAGGFVALRALSGDSGPEQGAPLASRQEIPAGPAAGTAVPEIDQRRPAGIEPDPQQSTERFESSRGVGESRRTAIVVATEKVLDTVVTVYVTERIKRVSTSIFESWFFGPQEQERAGLGSGVIISEDGFILTNDHVVGRADRITVQLADGREFEGVVVDTDPSRDLAVLKIDPPADLPVAELGDSSDIMIGEWVIALGSPFGFYINVNNPQPSVSVGVVSAAGRSFVMTSGGEVRYFPNTIQTDAAINPGNSGGPLVNGLGQVIGINSFILSQSGGSVGIGFAIPINQAKKALEQIRTYGYIRRPWTGLAIIRTNSPFYVYRNRVKDVAGALVLEITGGSPADKAGLSPGSVIVEARGKPIRSEQDLEEVLVQADIGDTIDIVYYSYPQRRRKESRLILEEEPRTRR